MFVKLYIFMFYIRNIRNMNINNEYCKTFKTITKFDRLMCAIFSNPNLRK